MCFGGNAAMGSGSVSNSQSSSSSSSSKPKRSAGRGSGKNKTTKQFATSTVSNIATDLKMGFSTFGLNKADQAAKLSEMGYSSKAIDSYQARTAATRERMASQDMRTEYGDVTPRPSSALGGSRASAPAPASSSEVPEVPTTGGEPGEAEQKVEAEAKSRKGRASTIQTDIQGLLTEPKTAKKKSLMNKMIS